MAVFIQRVKSPIYKAPDGLMKYVSHFEVLIESASGSLAAPAEELRVYRGFITELHAASLV